MACPMMALGILMTVIFLHSDDTPHHHHLATMPSLLVMHKWGDNDGAEWGMQRRPATAPGIGVNGPTLNPIVIGRTLTVCLGSHKQHPIPSCDHQPSCFSVADGG